MRVLPMVDVMHRACAHVTLAGPGIYVMQKWQIVPNVKMVFVMCQVETVSVMKASQVGIVYF